MLVFLDAGDVGADRDVAAVLGAALADMEPAAILELRLEGARARRRHAALRQAGVRIPQYESFRNVLDGIAQPQISFHRLFRETLLLGDVDRDADQVHAAA